MTKSCMSHPVRNKRDTDFMPAASDHHGLLRPAAGAAGGAFAAYNLIGRGAIGK
jgi:hypothetical protein